MRARRSGPLLLAVLVVWTIAVVSAAGQAPAGFRTHSDADSGLTFYYPIDYQEIPLPPTESVSKARYVRKTVPDVLKGEDILAKPSFEVFILPKEKGGTTVSGPQPAESRPESRPESAPESRSGPKTIREAFEAENRIEGFDEFRKR